MEHKETETENLIGLVFIYIFAFVALFLGLFALYFHFTTTLSVNWMIKLLFVDLALMIMAIMKPIFDITVEFFKDMVKRD
ncbi:hypothetical protein LCR01_14270 [Companilactobacillus crustorum]|uniref:Uncharacterized protein n=3 Tax=Companilactobacillus TaxID=2767879 RepID=A0A837RIG2_9LACO|nr:hypothetical protein [Companilactobacillus crustorum]KRK41714.1 hypothetical protein FD26_GL001208 [Companilactobacillus crustorum JCM 15951]KRO20472.1 hypothetical protein IV63_GL000494 [Companilactobacillus crustorum]GEO76984.1 hypothetical protein LCR01_14270 [Companilactobacillus crustorum]